MLFWQVCFICNEYLFVCCRPWCWMTKFKAWILSSMFWEKQKSIWLQLLLKHPTQNSKTNSGKLVWRGGGVTSPSVSSRWSSFSWTFLRHPTLAPSRQSLEEFLWSSMLLSFLPMVTLPKIMSWGTLTLVDRLVEMSWDNISSNFRTILVPIKVEWHG